MCIYTYIIKITILVLLWIIGLNHVVEIFCKIKFNYYNYYFLFIAKLFWLYKPSKFRPKERKFSSHFFPSLWMIFFFLILDHHYPPYSSAPPSPSSTSKGISSPVPFSTEASFISPSLDSHHHPCPSQLSSPPSLGLSWSDNSTISRLHLLSIINFSLALLGCQSVAAFHLLWSRSTIATSVSLRSSAESASPLIDQHHHHLAFPCWGAFPISVLEAAGSGVEGRCCEEVVALLLLP